MQIGVGMSDLIRREDVIDELMALRDAHKADQFTGDLLHWTGIKAMLESIPSAEPEPKNGTWIDEKINSYTSRTYCSECGSSAPFVYESDDYYGNHAHGETAKTKFCPNCGARMDLGE
jgi:ribosomal protein S27AE